MRFPPPPAVSTLMNSTIFWLELTPVPSFKFRSASYPSSAHISFSSSSAKAASVFRKLMIATAVFFIGYRIGPFANFACSCRLETLHSEDSMLPRTQKSFGSPLPSVGEGIGGEGEISQPVRSPLLTQLVQANLLQLGDALPNLLHKLRRCLQHDTIREPEHPIPSFL